MSYTSIGVGIGTTFTSISAADYAAQWSVSGSGPATTKGVVVRGHAGIRYRYGDRDYVIWPERSGVLAWVVVPNSMSDNLLTIAEGVRTIDGPSTIPYLVVTGLGSTWDASDNDSDGVVYARIGDAICAGIGAVRDPCSRTVACETLGGSGSRQIASIGPIGAAAARVELDDGSSYDFLLTPVQGLAGEDGFLGALPASEGSLTLSWIDTDGVVLAAERIDIGEQSDTEAATTSAISGEATVLVANASTVNGAAGLFTNRIADRYATFPPTNALQSTDRSVVYYAPGFEPAAQDLAVRLEGADIARMPALDSLVETDVLGTDLLVLVGNDNARTFDPGVEDDG